MTINSVATPIPFTISMYSDEQECLKTVYDSIGELIRYLEKRRVTRMVCTDTMELIEIDELIRVRGILDGLIRGDNWEGEVE